VLVASKAGYESQVVQLKLSPGQAVTERLALLTEEEGAATRKAVQEAEARRRAAQESLARTELAARVERAERRRGLRIGGWTGVAAGAFFALAARGWGFASEVQAARVRSVPDGHAVDGRARQRDPGRRVPHRRLGQRALGRGAARRRRGAPGRRRPHRGRGRHGRPGRRPRGGGPERRGDVLTST
jgi:hypothetical protein